MFSIPSEEYQANKDKYITQSSGMMSAVDVNTNKRKFISSEEYNKNKEQYKMASSGKVTCKNKDDWNDVRFLDKTDPLITSGQFIGINKGVQQSKETINKKVGSRNGSYGSFWITDGRENRRVKNKDIPKGWKRGRSC